MSSIRKLYYCATPDKEDVPVGTNLYRSSYAAAREFLKHHPDFDIDSGSYFGKQVFVGSNLDGRYDLVIGTVDIETDEGVPEPKTLLGVHKVQQMVYRDLAYDDFVAALPVLTVRKDYHEQLIHK